MARKATAGQKATAKKYGIRVTKTIRGKRVEKSAEQLKKEIATAKARLVKKKAAAKKRAASTRQTGSSVKSDDRRISSSTKAGTRKSKKTATLTYRVRDPKTGKMVTKRVRRKNANQHVSAGSAGGRKYTERRANRTDKGKFL
jgi:hypothetical protein